MNLPDSAPIQPIPGITTLWLYPATKKALPSAMPLSEKAYLEFFFGGYSLVSQGFFNLPCLLCEYPFFA